MQICPKTVTHAYILSGVYQKRNSFKDRKLRVENYADMDEVAK
jgi:hypothetical protein